ncbi:hypothetical protein [Amaricoccus sp.]|uniref:hypothetical protein n=1 Tax=Amaricoccus sp. TaxID=1872485 RepID=UPI001B6E9FDE|nr:hypothetical protein [Amaricoccus sp.]MBP7001219.1 hypothetical protein [Amaricoccus sp.]
MEIAARRSWAGRTLAGGVLTPELAEFCQSGVSICLGSRARLGAPVVGYGLGCRIDSAGRVRILLRRPASGPILQAVARGAAIAATFTRPFNHRAMQLKASRATVAEPTETDALVAEDQAAAFASELVGVGYDTAFAASYVAFEAAELAAIDFTPEQAFVQTPGPRAGSALGG